MQLALERRNPRLGLLEQNIEPLLTAERAGAGTGAHLQAVLGQAFQAHQALRDQRAHALAQQTIEKAAMCNPEVRQRVMVHAHPTADPAVDRVALAQRSQLPRAAHSLDRRVKPKRHEDLHIDRRTTGHMFASTDLAVKRLQIQAFHKSPDRANPVILRDKAIEIHNLKLKLVPPRLLKPHGTSLLRDRRRRNNRELFEQIFVLSSHRSTPAKTNPRHQLNHHSLPKTMISSQTLRSPLQRASRCVRDYVLSAR